ncbi:MAG: hypothetical protein QXX29_04635 [Nitrososphaerota archaeon]
MRAFEGAGEDGRQYVSRAGRRVIGMTKRIFVDTAENSKPHVCYDPDQDVFFEVKDLREAIGRYDKVYLDTLFASIYDEIHDLLENEVKVYLLRNPRLLKMKRMEMNLKKSDEVDARILSIIPKEQFKELTLHEIVLKLELWPLIIRYEELVKKIEVLKIWMKDWPEHSKAIKALLNSFRREKRKIAKKLHKRALCNGVYSKALEYFGIKGSATVAALILRIDLSRGVHRIKSFLGLDVEAQRRLKNYNHKARRLLSSFAATYYMSILRGTVNAPQKYIEIIKRYRGERNKLDKILYKFQCEIVKDLRRIWRTLNSEKQIIQTSPSASR